MEFPFVLPTYGGRYVNCSSGATELSLQKGFDQFFEILSQNQHAGVFEVHESVKARPKEVSQNGWVAL